MPGILGRWAAHVHPTFVGSPRPSGGAGAAVSDLYVVGELLIDEAASHAREALALTRRLGARGSEAHALCLAGDVASTGSAEDAPGYYSRSQSQRWVATGFENMRRYASGLARCVKNRRLPHIAAFFE